MVTYLRERFRLRVYVPLAAVMAFASATRLGSWRAIAADIAFALVLLLQFRTWDDLADREHDSRTHPQRALVRAPQVTVVIAFCGALAVLNLCLAVWRDASGVSVAALAALDGLLGAWYLARRTDRRTAVGDLILLAKYPVLLLVVSGARALDAPLQTGLAALAVYAAACGYEAWHDRDSGLTRRHRSLPTHDGVEPVPQPSLGER